jgi:hypothetical protein
MFRTVNHHLFQHELLSHLTVLSLQKQDTKNHKYQTGDEGVVWGADRWLVVQMCCLQLQCNPVNMVHSCINPSSSSNHIDLPAQPTASTAGTVGWITSTVCTVFTSWAWWTCHIETKNKARK